MGEARPNIPEEVKREVRKQCGFGCVICGDIVCDYEHIVPWSVCKEHKAANIALLCVKHHREITSKRLPKDAVSRAKADPYNFSHKDTPIYQFALSPQRKFVVGTNVLLLNRCSIFHVLLLRDKPVFSIDLSEGVPLFSLEIHGKLGGVLLKIVRNEVIIDPYKLWDVNLSGKNFIIRRKSRDICLWIEIDGGIINLRRVKLFCNGLEFDFSDIGTSIKSVSPGSQNLIHGMVSQCVMEAGWQYALFRVGKPNPPVAIVPALVGIGLPDDYDAVHYLA